MYYFAPSPNHGGHNQGLLTGRRENLGIRLPYLTCTRVAVDLFSNRSQMTSKCGKKGSGTRAAGKCVTDVFTTFWCSLWSITRQTYSNMESIKFCFIHAMIRKEKKTDTHLYTCLVLLDCSRIFASLGIF